MNKIALFLTLIIFSFNTLAEVKMTSPISLEITPFCNLKGLCKITGYMKNNTHYPIKIESRFFDLGSIKGSGVYLYDAEAYRLLEINNKLVYGALIEPDIKPKITSNLEVIEFKPQEKKYFDINLSDLSYKFIVDKSYRVQLHAAEVSIYIDGEYIGSHALYSEPKMFNVPQITNEKYSDNKGYLAN